jgi:hypothetical protein
MHFGYSSLLDGLGLLTLVRVLLWSTVLWTTPSDGFPSIKLWDLGGSGRSGLL